MPRPARNQFKHAKKNGLGCRECAVAQEHEDNERLADPFDSAEGRLRGVF